MSNSKLPLPSPKSSRTPDAIRAFVAQRAAAGMPLDLLAQLVGVGYQTVYSWCRKEVLASDGEVKLTAAQLRERNKQAAKDQAQLRILEVKRAAHEAAVEAQKLAAVRAETRKAKLLSRAEAQKLAAVRSESMQVKHEATAMAKKLDAVNREARKVKSEIRAKGLKILASERRERLAELRHIAMQQEEFRKQQEKLLPIVLAEESATRLEKAHALVDKVRALNPTAMNLHRISVELGVSVDDIFAAYKLTNRRFR